MHEMSSRSYLFLGRLVRIIRWVPNTDDRRARVQSPVRIDTGRERGSYEPTPFNAWLAGRFDPARNHTSVRTPDVS
jgi:hypothetical protein